MAIAAQIILEAARAEGFELAGLTPALPHRDFARYSEWVERGLAAGMTYLTDHRAAVREDPRNLLSTARTMLCVGTFTQCSHTNLKVLIDTAANYPLGAPH